MEIIDFHTHLGEPVLDEQSLVKRFRRQAQFLRESLPSRFGEGVTVLQELFDPVVRTVENLRLKASARFLSMVNQGRNRNIYFGRANHLLTRYAAPLVDASLMTGTRDRLLKQMDDNGVARSVVLPVEPMMPTDEILAMCRGTERLIPFISVDPETVDIKGTVSRGVARGGRGIKLHPTMQNQPVDSPFHFRVLEAAREHELPVLCHTGEVELPGFEHPEYSRIECFHKLVNAFEETPFVMAHMNLFEPEEAVSFALEHSNCHLEISWQPEGIIRHAVDTLGPERILFGSDWPLLGERVQIQAEILTRALAHRPADLELVFSKNAERLLDL